MVSIVFLTCTFFLFLVFCSTEDLTQGLCNELHSQLFLNFLFWDRISLLVCCPSGLELAPLHTVMKQDAVLEGLLRKKLRAVPREESVRNWGFQFSNQSGETESCQWLPSTRQCSLAQPRRQTRTQTWDKHLDYSLVIDHEAENPANPCSLPCPAENVRKVF